MAIALTSFVQPMLINNQSSDSSTPITTSGEGQDLMDKECCPSPSPSTNPPHSPSTSLSSSHSLMACHRKDSTSYSDIVDIDFEPNDKTLEFEKKLHGKTHTIDVAEDEEGSLSMSQCRYCYADILRKCNVSQCHCSGVLCQSCLIRELKLTHGRANGLLQCTVCKDEYDVETEFNFKLKRDCKSLCIDSLIHCGLKDEQYLLDSIGGKIGFFLVILGINTWILSTSLLFAFPPNGCPIELYYMVSIFDFAVGVSTIWFIIKCRYLSPLFLSIMYFVRFLYILLGWIPSINLCNIYIYHDYQSNHVSILSYFLSFSFIAFIVMGICWIIDLNHQYKKYEKENGKLVINTNHSKIEINDIATQENDQY